ncbi:MAG: hypothetical protein Q9196_002488 [Gyalolechia fulgens]
MPSTEYISDDFNKKQNQADLSKEISDKAILTTAFSPGGLAGFFNQNIAPAQPNFSSSLAVILPENQETADCPSKDHPIQLFPSVPGSWISNPSKNFREAAAVNSWSDVQHIDLVVKTPGIVACEYSKTEDGFGRQFAGQPVVVEATQDGELYNKWRAYGQGKTVNVLPTVALAKTLGCERLTAVSIHPSSVANWTRLRNTEYGIRQST